MTTDRIVRFTEAFFERLDYLLPEERGVDSTLSVTDFLVFELPPISERLATSFEESTLATEDDDVHLFVGHGLLVRYIAVFARLAVRLRLRLQRRGGRLRGPATRPSRRSHD